MKIDIVLQIAKLALAIADRLLYANVQGDPFFEQALLAIINKASQAYKDHTGKPVDPSMIKAESPA